MIRTLRATLSISATLLLALTFLAACGDTDEQRGAPGNDEQAEESDEDDTGSARTDQEEDQPEGHTQGEQEGEEGPAQPSDAVEVTLVDYEIQGLDTVEAGVVTFTTTNDAEHEHGIAVEPSDGSEVVGQMFVDPGETEQLELELEAGDYTVFCPVGDHREAEGMEAPLTVE